MQFLLDHIEKKGSKKEANGSCRNVKFVCYLPTLNSSIIIE